MRLLVEKKINFCLSLVFTFLLAKIIHSLLLCASCHLQPPGMAPKAVCHLVVATLRIKDAVSAMLVERAH